MKVSGEIARALTREGAKGFLASRDLATLDERSAGGVDEAARVDAFDERRGEENVGA